MAKQTNTRVFKILTGYLTATEVAKLFDRSVLTVMAWRDHKGLPYVIIPAERACIRFELSDMVAWANANKQPYNQAVYAEFVKGAGSPAAPDGQGAGDRPVNSGTAA